LIDALAAALEASPVLPAYATDSPAAPEGRLELFA
jgi:hypothetical protein